MKHICNRRFYLIFFATLSLVMIQHGSAMAHGFMESAVPQPNRVFHGKPPEVRIWFTQALEPAFCTMRVVDQSGQQVDKGDSHVDQIDPYLLRVSLRDLAPGNYQVTWRVVAVDAHPSAGKYQFAVAR